MELSPVEARVIGSLAEKQLTTPQQYPLTLNALTLACNQTSNRDPVVAYDEATIELALSSLKEAGFLRFVHPGHGRSATRYRQVFDERFNLDPRSLSVMAVLVLRGPQTVGELRARTERMADFETIEQVEWELEQLAAGSGPLVRRLPRRSGQKEDRWTQLLTGEPLDQDGVCDARAASTEAADASRTTSLGDDVAVLRADVEALREDILRINAIVEELRSVFDL